MDGNPAQVLARQIARTIPVAYGGGDLGEAAAYRFKCQVNENAKAPAFSAGVPEICHNEICGRGQHGDITRQITSVVRFRHDFEHPQITRRFELTRTLHHYVVHDAADTVAEADGHIARNTYA